MVGWARSVGLLNPGEGGGGSRPAALLGAALVLGALAGVTGRATGSAATPAERLPDLDERTPSALSVTRVRQRGATRFRLGFRSAMVNVGAGPLFIVGRRPSRDGPMTAEQVVALADGTTVIHPSVGKLRYERLDDHRHWHLLGFARYELRRPDGRLARPSLKRGFCLADSFRVRGVQNPPQPVLDVGYLDTDCGAKRPRARRVEEGISVGWGDDYDPHLEGQQIDVTGLRPGFYDLVNRSNPQRLLRETSYRNNAASLRLRLSWPGGRGARPEVSVVARCPGRERCPRRRR